MIYLTTGPADHEKCLPGEIDVQKCDFRNSVCKSKYSNKIIILSAIDNLIKGGAGQAVQNLNNKFNFSEKTGLK